MLPLDIATATHGPADLLPPTPSALPDYAALATTQALRRRAMDNSSVSRMMSLPGWWQGAAMVRLAEAQLAESRGELTERDVHLREAGSHEGRAIACLRSEERRNH